VSAPLATDIATRLKPNWQERPESKSLPGRQWELADANLDMSYLPVPSLVWFRQSWPIPQPPSANFVLECLDRCPAEAFSFSFLRCQRRHVRPNWQKRPASESLTRWQSN
jgi:hypothetical protein